MFFLASMNTNAELPVQYVCVIFQIPACTLMLLRVSDEFYFWGEHYLFKSNTLSDEYQWTLSKLSGHRLQQTEYRSAALSRFQSSEQKIINEASHQTSSKTQFYFYIVLSDTLCVIVTVCCYILCQLDVTSWQILVGSRIVGWSYTSHVMCQGCKTYLKHLRGKCQTIPILFVMHRTKWTYISTWASINVHLALYMYRSISGNTVSLSAEGSVCIAFSSSLSMTCLQCWEITVAAWMKTFPLFLGSHLPACFVCLCMLHLSLQQHLMLNKAAAALRFQRDTGRCSRPTSSRWLWWLWPH